MSRPFTGEERAGAVLALKDMMSRFLDEPGNRLLTATLVEHLRMSHGFTPEDAFNEIVSLECEAIRKFADTLEERAAEAIHQKTSKTM